MNDLREEYGIEPNVWARLDWRAIRHLRTYGLTKSFRRLLWVHRFKAGLVEPAWLANSDDQQDTFDEDYHAYQQRQWENGQHD